MKILKYLSLIVLLSFHHIFAQHEHLPVELIYFNGNQKDDRVELRWGTATEVNNYGFEIHRSLASESGPWEVLGFVEGHGTIYSANDYSFSDSTLISSGKIYYRLYQIDTDGNTKHSDVISVNFLYTSVEHEISATAEEFSLAQNYPNPFNPATGIGISTGASGAFVTLKVYDLQGRELITALNNEFMQGSNTIALNMKDYPSGVYFYRAAFIRGKEISVMTKVMTMLK